MGGSYKCDILYAFCVPLFGIFLNFLGSRTVHSIEVLAYFVPLSSSAKYAFCVEQGARDTLVEASSSHPLSALLQPLESPRHHLCYFESEKSPASLARTLSIRHCHLGFFQSYLQADSFDQWCPQTCLYLPSASESRLRPFVPVFANEN